MKTFDVYRANGEWVNTVQANNEQDALIVAWRKYFGDPNGILSPRNDGTLKVIEKK